MASGTVDGWMDEEAEEWEGRGKASNGDAEDRIELKHEIGVNEGLG